MQTDDRGLDSTTSHAEAAHALERAIHAFNHWRVDAMDLLGGALKLDPTAPMAYAAQGLMLGTGRNERFRPLIEESLLSARHGLEALGSREALYVEALSGVAAGRLHDAVLCYETILNLEPTDLFAQRLIQQELFWMGEAHWMADVVERTAPAWSSETPDYAMFLSVRAFSLEEAGRRGEAERFGREAVERDPGDCWGAHAIAHVLLMDGRVDEGIEWLEGLCRNWAGKNQIVHHLWWHLCLFLLERREHDRILALYDREVRNPDSPLVQAVPDAYIDIQNAASLLLRLELRGVNVGERWQGIAEVAEQRIANHASPFTDAHAAMILAANGELAKAEELLQSMQSFAATDAGSLGPRYRNAAVAAARAAIAHRRNDHEGVVSALMPARRDLWQMGGSHAQRDVFLQILTDSCRRLGRRDYLAMILAEIEQLGFDRPGERTLYADAIACQASTH